MKQIFLSLAFLFCMNYANAQTDFEHSQTRIQEGMSEFFVRPMVAELEMLTKECYEWPAIDEYPGVPMSEMTSQMLENAKANAAWKAAHSKGADIILGATFHVVNNKKKKGLTVIVRGYPAKYVKFHNFGTEDKEWIDQLQNGARIRAAALDGTYGSVKAVETNTQK